MEKSNPEWKREQVRIDYMKKVLEEKIAGIVEDTEQVKGDILELRRSFWDDVTVNVEELDDIIETYASIKQQAELMSERERNYGQFHKLVKRYERQKENPYFGRIDFKEDGEEEAIYIGIGSVKNEEKEEFLVYDWRAPISSLYYDHSPGPAFYETPEGKVSGDIKLKRQFLIKQGKLKGMFDTGVTIVDELLQQALGGSASTQMKSIVATIQKEQNRIIRYKGTRRLVVQGVAGSGKTSAAMQRIAYLLYRDRKSITADQILLFSPNHMFMSYVASVLPELGEENMKQTTFYEYGVKRFEHLFTLETPFEQLEYLLEHKDEARITGIQYKSTIECKEDIDQYVEQLGHQGMIFRGISFKGKRVITSEDIAAYFYSLKGKIPNRIEKVREWLFTQIELLEKKERKKEWALEEASYLDKHDYIRVYKELEKEQNFNEDTFDEFNKEEEQLVNLVVKRKLQPLRKKIDNLHFIHISALYGQFYDWLTRDGNIEETAIRTKSTLKNKVLHYEDMTPLLYLQDQLEGRKVSPSIRYLFIDEAQDYSPFQLEYIQQLFPNAHMNLLGDFNQAIHTLYSSSSSPLENEHSEVERIQLMKSYRSTKPIVEFTKQLISGGEAIEAFNRDGNKPRVHEVHQYPPEVISGLIEKRLVEGHETIAVLTRTKSGAIDLHKEIARGRQAKLIYKETQSFEKGVLILPAYLAKGIEFDAVIIPDASKTDYAREEERKLFYTACTRAMHELDLLYTGEATDFLKGVDDSLYRTMGHEG